jgi:hypothetical protein
MAIDETTVVPTAEICGLCGFSRQYLRALERDGIVVKAGENQWPLGATIRSLLEYGNRPRGNEARQRFEEARAATAELKLSEGRRLIHDTAVAWTKEMVGEQMTMIAADLDGFPARYTRDMAERKRLAEDINAMRRRWAAKLRARLAA